MATTAPDDRWQNAEAYERFMGRWSRALAERFVAWLAVAPGAHWLEVGCGTGALTAAICASGTPATVVACDPATDFADYCRATRPHRALRVVVAGAGSLPGRDGGYDAVVSSLVLNFLPRPVAALTEMRDLCSAGGLVAACVWDYAAGMEPLRAFWDAAAEVDSAATPLDEAVRFPLCQPDRLRAAFGDAGLVDIEVAALAVPIECADFDDFWSPFLGGAGPAPAHVAALDHVRRDRLVERLRARLAPAADGAILLSARAWAVSGARAGRRA